MPQSLNLTTGWLTIATANNTVDNREITAEHLEEMAATYDTKEYTSAINVEHRFWMSTLGTVEELRAQKDKKGRTILQARLKPSAEYLNRIANNQGKFFSIERAPNFANTKKSYLVGLASTDIPASVGIEAVNYSSEESSSSAVQKHYGATVEVSPDAFNMPSPDQEPTSDEINHKILSFFKQLFTTPKTKEQEEMNKEELSQLFDEKFAAFETKLEEKFAAAFDPDKNAATPAAPAADPDEDKFSQQLKAAEDKFAAEKKELEDKFNALKEEVDNKSKTVGNETDNMGAQTGASEDAQAEVW